MTSKCPSSAFRPGQYVEPILVRRRKKKQDLNSEDWFCRYRFPQSLWRHGCFESSSGHAVSPPCQGSRHADNQKVPVIRRLISCCFSLYSTAYDSFVQQCLDISDWHALSLDKCQQRTPVLFSSLTPQIAAMFASLFYLYHQCQSTL